MHKYKKLTPTRHAMGASLAAPHDSSEIALLLQETHGGQNLGSVLERL